MQLKFNWKLTFYCCFCFCQRTHTHTVYVLDGFFSFVIVAVPNQCCVCRLCLPVLIINTARVRVRAAYPVTRSIMLTKWNGNGPNPVVSWSRSINKWRGRMFTLTSETHGTVSWTQVMWVWRAHSTHAHTEHTHTQQWWVSGGERLLWTLLWRQVCPSCLFWKGAKLQPLELRRGAAEETREKIWNILLKEYR